jgi:guanylate kinase
MLLDRCPELSFSVSHTTRTPRPGEIDGRDYHFVDRNRFADLVDSSAFLEWAEVHGNMYGTSRAEIDRAGALAGCTGLIFDIDYQGARQIKFHRPDAVAVFVLPPSMAELERRLHGRASETEESLRRRFAFAEREIEHYALFDYLVVNDVAERAFDELRSITVAERARRSRRAGLAELLLRIGKIA